MAGDSKVILPTWAVGPAYAIAGAVISGFFSLNVAAGRADEKALSINQRLLVLEQHISSVSSHAARIAVAESKQDDMLRRLGGIEDNLGRLVGVFVRQPAATAKR